MLGFQIGSQTTSTSADVNESGILVPLISISPDRPWTMIFAWFWASP